MYKDYRYINAGENEFYRWGHKAQEKVTAFMTARNGWYSIPADGGKYWTFGTSKGKFGEFIKWNDVFFSVNSIGRVYAKEGTEKGEKFIEMLKSLVTEMQVKKMANVPEDDEDEDVE